MSLVYLICTSPRSASTLLCQGLANTGRAGAPDEYFDRREESVAYWRYRFGITDSQGFAERVIEATSSPAGVFGAKLHWTTYPDLYLSICDGFAPRVSGACRSLNDLLLARFSAVRYIWLRRRNKVAQGISHFRASRTNIWQIPSGHPQTDRAGGEVQFNFGMIDYCVTLAEGYDRRWANYFDTSGLRPLQIIYEDFVESYDQTLRRVMEYLEIPHQDLPRAEPPLERMADHISQAWEQKYRKMKAERLSGSR